jgi:RPA family protein
MREVAWRVFASEYNDSVHELSDGGERSPSYVLTPLGAKINRIFAVGVLTDVENVGTDAEPMWRARLSDPTGVFHIYSGQYQPEASAVLAKIRPPAFAAVMGKSRTYRPESGAVYTSVRPEMVKTVDEKVRDYWILEACRGLRRRLHAVREAYAMEPLTKEGLVALGTKEATAEGIVAAVERYGKVDLSRYASVLAEALRYLLPEYQPYREEEAPVEEERPEEEDEGEETVLRLVGELDVDDRGAPWDALLSAAQKEGLAKERLEELTNALLDKGVVYEPILGRIKRI